MAKALRVFNIAKELGVTSKEVIAKCKAEGVELKNHMATVSLGLAESIREWFSAGDDVTTIEIAPPAVIPETTESAEEETPSEDQVATSTAVAEVVEEPAAVEAPEPTTAEVPAAEETTTAEPEEVPPTEEVAQAPVAGEEAPVESRVEAPVSAKVEEPTPVEPTESEVEVVEPVAEVELSAEPVAEPEVAEEEEKTAAKQPKKPKKPVAPAGPQVVPTPAALQGPRLVRMEQPEQIRAPRPRTRPTGPRPPRPAVPAAGQAGPAPAGPTTPKKGRGRRAGESEEAERNRKARKGRRGNAADVSEKLREWRDQDLIERKERLANVTGQGLRSRRAAEKRRQASGPQHSAVQKSEVEITVPITLKDYCSAIGIPYAQVVRRVMEHTGQMLAINQSIEGDIAELIALDFGVTVKMAQAKTELEKLVDEVAARERANLESRAPVVAMLGHVDHGKTSLLDRIRDTEVASGEAGGITQHIGASRIKTSEGPVTFLDTPGHEAFTAMRARGANMTDVVVLVVAADDGVMPQTAEAINHAKAAGVQIVVALNKIDLPGIDLNKVYSQLAEHELAPTGWGGETDVIKTSATTGEGIDDLLTHLGMLSELMELKADSTVPAVGTVVESEMKGGQGVVTRVLVQEGTLRVGQIIVCGPGYGKVRTLLDHRGKRITEATPGMPVGVVGLDELPDAGDRLYVVDDNSRAKGIAEEVKTERRQASLRKAPKAKGLEELLAAAGDADIPVLSVIVKADVQGSVETLKAQLAEFPADKAELRLLHAGVGVVSEADVQLAQASQAIIVGFHVVADDRAKRMADELGVEIRLYRVIYEMLEDIHKALEGLLEPVQQEESRGTAEVRQVFSAKRLGTVAGCYVLDGIINRKCKVRLVRDGRIIREGADIDSLRRFKDDVREVKSGFECGIKLAKFDDVKPGDRMEAYEIIEVSAKL